MGKPDVALVVAVDFGTTFSGFAYRHVKSTGSIVTNNRWPTRTGTVSGRYKCSTALHYRDGNSWEVEAWGAGAVADPSRRARTKAKTLVAELFKLHLLNLNGTLEKPGCGAGSLFNTLHKNAELEKPILPEGLHYTQAIRDFLTKMNEWIRDTVTTKWPGVICYPRDVLFVFSVPAEYDIKKLAIMRKLIYEAGFIESRHSDNLKFTTEPEAAALYCMQHMEEYRLNQGDCFLTVDCGGGTVDLTARLVMSNEQLGEITIRTGAACGGSFVDREFIKFLDEKLGGNVMSKIQQNHHHHYQHLCDFFSRSIKAGFTDDESTYETREVDLQAICPPVRRYVVGSVAADLDDDDWTIEITFHDLKAMFDPVINQITGLVREQVQKISARKWKPTMFVVGGFAESQYLLNRLKDTFSNQFANIVCPPEPETAIMRGAAYYGLNIDSIPNRVLKWTYGIGFTRKWRVGDAPERRRPYDRISIFRRVVMRGTQVGIDETYTCTGYPVTEDQTSLLYTVYYTLADDAEYPDEPGVVCLGDLKIDLPDVRHGLERPTTFSLSFGTMEIKATAICELTGKSVKTILELDI